MDKEHTYPYQARIKSAATRWVLTTSFVSSTISGHVCLICLAILISFCFQALTSLWALPYHDRGWVCQLHAPSGLTSARLGRSQALTYSLALLRHWNGLPSNYVALIDVDEYIVIDQPKASRAVGSFCPHQGCPLSLSLLGCEPPRDPIAAPLWLETGAASVGAGL